jgi:hypothetical protein
MGGYVGNLKVLSEINLGGFAPPPLEKVNFRHWPQVSRALELVLIGYIQFIMRSVLNLKRSPFQVQN